MDFSNETRNTQKNLELGNRLKQQGLFDEALHHYNSLLEIDKCNPIAWHQQGRIYEIKGELNTAINCYKKALENQPNNDKIYIHLARIFRNIGKVEDVINAYQKAIKLNPEQDYKVYRELGNALRKNGQIKQAVIAYQKAAQFQPDSPDIYILLAKHQAQIGEIEKAIANYQKAIKLEPNQPPWVHKNLANALKQQQKNIDLNIYLSIWKFLNKTNLNVGDKSQFPDLENIKHENLEKCFARNSNYKIINRVSLSKEDKEFMNTLKISLETLDLIKKDNSKQQETYLKKYHHNPTISPSKLELDRPGLDISYMVFQQSMIETANIYTICPISGQILKSNQSFLWMMNTAYRFVGEEIFYLIVRGGSFRQEAVYFPKFDLIINFSARFHSHKSLMVLVNKLKAFMVKNWSNVLAYLADFNNKKVVASLGFQISIQHHLELELSGIYRLLKANIIDKVDKFLVGDNEYYGSLDEIFPEIPREKLIKISKFERENVNKIILDNKYFALAVRDRFVPEELVNRIYQVALKKCTPCFLSKVEMAKKHFPIIWITIRASHRRVWISQVEGIANILKQLHNDYPNLAVVFDGVSRLDRDNSDKKFSQNEEAMIQSEMAVVNQILPLLSNTNISVYNSIGSMMYESIVWSHAIDLYIAPFGSGLAKVTFIANKPGIVHTNRTGLKNALLKDILLYQRENGITPTPLSSEHIIDTESSDTKPVDYSYDCNWKNIYNKVIQLLHKLSKI